jgi:hypothetical protein
MRKSPKEINNKDAAIWIYNFLFGANIKISSLMPRKNKIIKAATVK